MEKRGGIMIHVLLSFLLTNLNECCMQPPPQESAETTSSAWFSYTSCDNYGLCDEDDEDTCYFDGEPTAEIPSCHKYATSDFYSPMSDGSGDNFMSISSQASSVGNAAPIIGFCGRVGHLTINPVNVIGRRWNRMELQHLDQQLLIKILTRIQLQTTTMSSLHTFAGTLVWLIRTPGTPTWIQFQFYDGTNTRNSPYLVMRVEDYYVTHFFIYNNENVVGLKHL